jgi:ADP-heptose:LPS heptosyltransferase
MNLSIKTHVYKWQYRIRERCIVAACLLGDKPPAAASFERPAGDVAFVLVGMLGDTVMCLPVLEAAREAWPRTRICAVVTPRIREMLSGVSYIDEFLVGTGDPLSVRGREQARQTEERLRAENFEAGILLGGDQYAPLLYRAGIPIRVGPAPCVYEPLLTHTYLVDDGRTWGPNERLGALRALGVETAARIPRLETVAQGRLEFQRWREARGDAARDDFVVIHPFGSTARQRWPLDRVPQLTEQVFQSTGWRSLLVGGPEFRDALASPVGAPSLIDAVGAFSLPELLAAIESARLVVTTDSGPFHMAGALGRPIVGLFRGSRPEHAGRYPRARVLLGRDSACEKLCHWNYCQAAPCRQLESLSVEEVLNEVMRAYELENEESRSF